MKNLKPYLLLLLVACSSNPEPAIVQDNTVIEFTLVNSSSVVDATRAAADLLIHESTITSLDILFYEGENLVFYPTTTQMSTSGNRSTITIPNTTAINMFGRTLKVYILANCKLSRTVLDNLPFSTLTSLVQTNSPIFNKPIFEPQVNFLMDGQIDVTLTQGVNNLGTVNLKRAAAKISVEIISATVTGYNPGVATVTFCRALDKTALGTTGTQYQSQTSDLYNVTRSTSDPLTLGNQVIEPFYSYTNDWEFDAAKENYIIIAVPWTSTGGTKTYYYRLPMSYLRTANETDVHEFRLRRNYIYQFKVAINALGSLDPETATEIDANFNLIDWSTQEIDVAIPKYDYLVVYERSVVMKNTSTYTIKYSSSTPIQITDAKAYCSEYAVSGAITQKNYVAGTPDFPRVTIDQTTGTFKISCIVPTNYVPRTMTFTVTNTAGLKQYVTVTMYPAKYISAQQAPNYSSGNTLEAGSNLGGGSNSPNGSSTATNMNMFTITTTALGIDDRMADGAPFFGAPITIGDPTTTVNGVTRTRTDLASNSIMSPKFVIASQRGISTLHTYDNAVLRCQGYQEQPYGRGTWRVPTAAELAYGNRLQTDPNSAVKGLFSAGNNSWWTAFQYYAFNFGTNSITVSGSNVTTYYIRCVHDVWKDL